ncbi:hypothetical protein C8Q74DRAFT_1210269 [Fomes fomentarius]|nr:hypothetical protein C8Q74DRAFT_1210269 [Fomes fomentarius]
MPISLISVSCLMHVGFCVHSECNTCKITTPIGNTLVPIPGWHGVFPLFGVEPHRTSPTSKTAVMMMSALEFHHQMGDAYPPTLQRMVTQGTITGIDLNTAKVEFCEVCQQVKQSFPKTRQHPQAMQYSKLVHSDVWGKAQVRSWD